MGAFRVCIALVLMALVAAKKDKTSDLNEQLNVDKLDRATPLDESNALLSATPQLREQIRRENAAAQREWELANPDLVAEHKRNMANTKPTLDTSSLVEQLQQRGLVKKDDKAEELARQFDLSRASFFSLPRFSDLTLHHSGAREKARGVYEQEVDGRVVEFKTSGGGAAPPAEDICQLRPEQCRGTLGVPRWAMPQFKAEGSKAAFLENAEKLGFTVQRRRVRIGELGVVQAEILESKAKGFQEAFSDGKKGKKVLEEYAGKGTPVIGGDVLDGHHHFAAALKAAGPKAEIAAAWVTKIDKKTGKEVALTREDKLKLWRASINTKGVTREDLAPAAPVKADIQRSFRRFGKKRTRKGESGYDYRREYVMNLWNQRKQQRTARTGGRPARASRTATVSRGSFPRAPAAAPRRGAYRR